MFEIKNEHLRLQLSLFTLFMCVFRCLEKTTARREGAVDPLSLETDTDPRFVCTLSATCCPAELKTARGIPKSITQRSNNELLSYFIPLYYEYKHRTFYFLAATLTSINQYYSIKTLFPP